MDLNKKNTIENVFNRAALTYNTIGPKFFSYFGEKLVKGAGLRKGANVLDVAMGRGAVLFAAAAAVGSAGHVTGIDIASSMVEGTNKELLKRSLKNVTLARMDAENLEFPDRSFDNVLCGFGIFFCPDHCRALNEMRRVLKPNGGFAISTWVKSEGRRDWIPEALKKTGMSVENIKHRLKLLPASFEEPEEIKEKLASAGFSDITITREEKDFIYADEEEWWQAQWSHGVRAPLECIEEVYGQAGLERFKTEALKLIRSQIISRGYVQTFKAYLTFAKVNNRPPWG